MKAPRNPAKRSVSRKVASSGFDLEKFFVEIQSATKLVDYGKKTNIFVQGEPADSVFYIKSGEVKLTVTSEQGKVAIIGVLSETCFFGEGCVAGQPLRMMTASAVTKCILLRIAKPAMIAALHEYHPFSQYFIEYVLSRNIRYEADLVDQLFNSSEKRLARVLLLLSRYGKEGQPVVIPKISHETLAQMVGTSRPHVNRFMNKFRKLGFIKYNGGLEVHKSLLNMTLHD